MTAELPVGTESAALRCADSDREQVVRLLNTAFAEGRLTREEHDERIDATWVSRAEMATRARSAQSVVAMVRLCVPTRPVVASWWQTSTPSRLRRTETSIRPRLGSLAACW